MAEVFKVFHVKLGYAVRSYIHMLELQKDLFRVYARKYINFRYIFTVSYVKPLFYFELKVKFSLQ